MENSKQGGLLEYVINLQLVVPDNDLFTKGADTLVYLLQPEETEDGAEISRSRARLSPDDSTRATIKLFFWYAISVILSMLLAQMK